MNEEDLQQLSSEKLRELALKIQTELKVRAKRDRVRAQRQILELAQAHQVDLRQLAKAKVNPPPAALYQNPDNQFEQWSGRGRQPKWLSDALKNGASLEDFKVNS